MTGPTTIATRAGDTAGAEPRLTRYEYALIRYVHDHAGEEFVNVGVVLFSPDHAKLFVRITEHYRRLSEFFGDLTGAGYRGLARHLQYRFLALDEEWRRGSLFSPPAAGLAAVLQDRLGNPTYSCFTASAVRYGVSRDPGRRLDRLYFEFVERYEETTERLRRDEAAIAGQLQRGFLRSGLDRRLDQAYRVIAPDYTHEFLAAWGEGSRQVIEPISLDLAAGTRIVDKANLWSGRMYTLSRATEFALTAVVAAPAAPELIPAYNRAVKILRAAPSVRDVVEERDTDRVLTRIAAELPPEKPSDEASAA